MAAAGEPRRRSLPLPKANAATPLPASPPYRPDVDGLRAVAAVAVVAFHAAPAYVPGGYYGVDVFFVISGYLICSILSPQAKDKPSLFAFYRSRVNRIFPTALLVLAMTFVLGCLTLAKPEVLDLGLGTAASAVFVQNLVLGRGTGYFDSDSATNPLLHMWSLGVEWQFYLLFPPLLALAGRLAPGRRGVLALAGVALLSLLAAVLARPGSSAAFFLPHARAWEFLAGALIALTFNPRTSTAFAASDEPARSLLRKGGLGPGTANLISVLGLSLLLLPLTGVDTPAHPGVLAVLPVAGTAMVIAAGGHAWPNRVVLGSRPLVAIGLISYPLYLWHWPLLSFATTLSYGSPSPLAVAAVVIASLVLAWATYATIERPLRALRRSSALAGLMIAAATCLALLATASALEFLGPGREQDGYTREFDYFSHWLGWEDCEFIRIRRAKTEACKIMDGSRSPTVAVVGDSHAGHLATGLREALSNTRHNPVILGRAGCFPVYSTTKEADGPRERFHCRGGLIDAALDYVAGEDSIKTVVLSGYANMAIHGQRLHLQDQSRTADPARVAVFREALLTTVAALQKSGKRVLLLSDVPELLEHPRHCVKRSVDLPGSQPSNCDVDMVGFLRRSAAQHAVLADIKAALPETVIAHTYTSFCELGRCRATADGASLYSSRDHLSPTGSRRLAHHLGQLIGANVPDSGVRGGAAGEN